MKNTFLFLSFLFIISSCSSLGIPTKYGENYKKDKFERNGFRGSSELVIKNKMPEEVTITVSQLDGKTKEVVSSQDYKVQGITKRFLFKKAGKVKVGLGSGWVRVDDNFFDQNKFEVVPGIKYKTVLSGDRPIVIVDDLGTWFSEK